MRIPLRPLILLSAFATAAPAFAGVVNGNFAQGFSGWTQFGDTSDNGTTSGGPTNSFAYFSPATPSGVSQTFTDTISTNTINFLLSNEEANTNSFSVAINGVTLHTDTDAPAFDFTAFSYDFTGTGSDTVTFTFVDDSAAFFLTGVNATAVTAVTPEPSSLILLGTGILSLTGAARRKYRKA